MGKKSRRKPGARRYADYTEETLNLAVDLVKTKALSSYEAEKHFGIPRRTILNHCNNKHDMAIGRPNELSAEEESHIADVVEITAEFGCPLSLLDLRIVVYNYLQKSGKTKPFNGKMPGERWARNFLERHNFTMRATQNIKRNRAAKTIDELSTYYRNLETSIKDVPGHNILNFDETNLSDDPGLPKSIFKRGTKHPERVLNSSKTSISIMFSVTGDGECLPPYVVYKAEHLWSQWCDHGPPNARYNRTKSGWFDMVCFDDWFKTIVLPWANSREGPKVIIGDNLASHLSVEVVQLCRESNIKLVFLPPNSTHLTQPLDVAFFGPMKKVWRKILLNYKLTNKNATTINKTHFPQLLRELMIKIDMTSSNNICSGFAASGIFPFDPSRVLRKIPVVSTEGAKIFDITLLEYLQENRKPTIKTQRNNNKKLTVVAGKSVAMEDVEKSIKGKGKGKSTKTSNNVKREENFHILPQPKSLKMICTQFVNELLLQTDQLTKAGRKTPKKKTLKSNVRLLSQVSKSDKENKPFVLRHDSDIPICLQSINCDNTRVTLSKPVLKSKITILSNEIITAGPSNISKTNTFQSFNNQQARSKNINIQRKRVSVGISALHTEIIPKKKVKIVESSEPKNVPSSEYFPTNISDNPTLNDAKGSDRDRRRRRAAAAGSRDPLFGASLRRALANASDRVARLYSRLLGYRSMLIRAGRWVARPGRCRLSPS